MGLSLNIDVNNENEFNQQLQLYLSQGYTMQSNFNGTAILKKKSYSLGLLIVLIILFFPAAIIYYLVATDDIVTIRQKGTGPAKTDNVAEEYFAYCENCGQGLLKDSKFCPSCGHDVSDINKEEVLTCKNCGEEITGEAKFCHHCGYDLTENEDPSEDEPAETADDTKVCENCGEEIMENEKFCSECGEEIKE